MTSGVLLFSFHQPVEKKEEAWQQPTNRTSSDRVVLVENREEAKTARIHLIENATTTLDIAYYTIHAGTSSDMFFTSIVEAADRGVHVRVMLDGVFHNLRGKRKEMVYAFSAHPNIKLKLYEPLDIIRPWTWNNRLHDKLIIVDQKYAMIGGRNIGDAYFADENYEGAKRDRDVIIINPNNKFSKHSVIFEMKDYYQMLWDHSYSKKPITQLTNQQQQEGDKKLKDFRQLHREFQASYPEIYQQDINWLAMSYPTNSISFVYNPIERFNKDPLVWKELIRLMLKAEKSIFIQSPYIIPTDKMLNYLDPMDVIVKDVVMLTNSLAATPNLLAYSGYSHYREQLPKAGIQLYEFQSEVESLHAKTFIIDDNISAIGTFNLDPRSAFLSTEVMVIIDSKEFTQQLKVEINEIRNKSSLVVHTDESYIEHSKIEESSVSVGKKMSAKILSMVTRFFHHML